MLNNVLLRMRVLLVLLVVSLTACAHNSTKPESASRPAVALPSETTPQPSTPYSAAVQQLLKEWREMLTATPLTPEVPEKQ